MIAVIGYIRMDGVETLTKRLIVGVSTWSVHIYPMRAVIRLLATKMYNYKSQNGSNCEFGSMSFAISVCQSSLGASPI